MIAIPAEAHISKAVYGQALPMGGLNITVDNTSRPRQAIFGYRNAALLITALLFIGISISLSMPLYDDTTIRILKRTYSAVALVMTVFGFYSIIRHHPLCTTIYVIFFWLNALLSIIFNSLKIQEGLVSDMKVRDIIVLSLHSLDVLFCFVSSYVMFRFYRNYRRKYLCWEANYSNDSSEGGASFHRYCHRHNLSAKRRGYNEAHDTLSHWI